ncbi:3-methyl-2-oxobutanoate hydroxymethyltransferase, partial [candidate division KSB1 bacterium]
KYCDGQVLVSHDMLGLYEKFQPKFVRRYAELGKAMSQAFKQYINDVKQKNFPNDDESY